MLLVLPEHVGQRRRFRREQELVQIDERQPARATAGSPQRIRVGPALAALTARGRTVEDRHDTRANPWLNDLLAAIGAAVVVEEELLDAYEPMKLDPLRQVVRLIFEDRAGRKVSQPHPGHDSLGGRFQLRDGCSVASAMRRRLGHGVAGKGWSLAAPPSRARGALRSPPDGQRREISDRLAR